MCVCVCVCLSSLPGDDDVLTPEVELVNIIIETSVCSVAKTSVTLFKTSYEAGFSVPTG